MDSLVYLQGQLIRLSRKYPSRPRYCALRMAIASAHALFMRYAKNICPLKETGKTPSIVFLIQGGLGDLIIARNYIYHFYQYISKKPFQIKICYHYPDLLKELGTSLPGVTQTAADVDELSGVLKIELNRYPRILAGDVHKLSSYSSELGKILASWKQFQIHNRKLFDLMPQTDSLCNDYSLLLGAKRINQADIGGLLGIREEYAAPLPMPANPQQLLNELGLADCRYVTLQRGHSTVEEKSQRNTKLWPLQHYQTLIKLLKKTYPNYKLVQLGTNRAGFDIDFDEIDINLRGKTSISQLCVILKHSSLHVDCEGGLVHLRHALKGGPSVVLFGPTDPEFYGYTENLNLRTHVCNRPCEWVTDDWLTRCARRKDKDCCMRSLTPQWVLKRIKEEKLL